MYWLDTRGAEIVEPLGLVSREFFREYGNVRAKSQTPTSRQSV